jgi:predicted Zn finger-like uncharacterized protein
MTEVANCPSCRRALRVPDDLLGHEVKCPACGTVFTTNAVGAAPVEEAPPRPREPEARREHEPERRRARSERVVRRTEEDDERPRRYGDEEDGPRRRREPRREDDSDEDDSEEEEDRPRRRRGCAEHRGGLILALGILSLFTMPLILGPIAWVMGSNDLHEMRAGRMDPEGEGNTATGRTLGMVSTLLCLTCIAGVLGVVALGVLGSL